MVNSKDNHFHAAWNPMAIHYFYAKPDKSFIK